MSQLFPQLLVGRATRAALRDTLLPKLISGELRVAPPRSFWRRVYERA